MGSSSSSWRSWSSSLLLSTATDWVKDERNGGAGRRHKTAHRYVHCGWAAVYVSLYLGCSFSFSFFNSVAVCTHINYLKLIHNIFYFHLTKAQMASNQFGQAQGAVCSINRQAGEDCFFFFLGNAASLGQWQRAKAGNTCSCARKTYRKRCDKR